MTFFTQIVMTILAIGISFFYINPTFINIGVLQDSILLYQAEKQKVDSVNAQLASLKQKINNISQEDQRALMTYLPERIDQMAISRDVLFMAESSGVFLESIRYDKVAQVGEGEEKDPNLLVHSFIISLVGEYEDIKEVFAKFEQNNYPLEIVQLTLGADETDIITAEVVLNTYSYSNPNSI